MADVSDAVANAMLDAVETVGGTSVVLKVRTGSKPATADTADSGSVLSSITCPSDWAAAAAARQKAKSGTWQDLSADDTGTAGHWRLYQSDGTTCILQGTVSLSGEGGELILSTLDFIAGGVVTVSAFTLSM